MYYYFLKQNFNQWIRVYSTTVKRLSNLIFPDALTQQVFLSFK